MSKVALYALVAVLVVIAGVVSAAPKPVKCVEDASGAGAVQCAGPVRVDFNTSDCSVIGEETFTLEFGKATALDTCTLLERLMFDGHSGVASVDGSFYTFVFYDGTVDCSKPPTWVRTVRLGMCFPGATATTSYAYVLNVTSDLASIEPFPSVPVSDPAFPAPESCPPPCNDYNYYQLTFAYESCIGSDVTGIGRNILTDHCYADAAATKQSLIVSYEGTNTTTSYFAGGGCAEANLVQKVSRPDDVDSKIVGWARCHLYTRTMLKVGAAAPPTNPPLTPVTPTPAPVAPSPTPVGTPIVAPTPSSSASALSSGLSVLVLLGLIAML